MKPAVTVLDVDYATTLSVNAIVSLDFTARSVNTKLC